VRAVTASEWAQPFSTGYQWARDAGGQKWPRLLPGRALSGVHRCPSSVFIINMVGRDPFIRSAIKDRTNSSAVFGDEPKPTSHSVSVHRSTSSRPSFTPASEKVLNTSCEISSAVEASRSKIAAASRWRLSSGYSFRLLGPPAGLFFEIVSKFHTPNHVYSLAFGFRKLQLSCRSRSGSQ
jgi:hypothetical protein